MTKSSRLRDWPGGSAYPVVTQECFQDAGSSARQGDDGPDVLQPFPAPSEVEVPVRPVADDADLRGHVDDPSQAGAVTPEPIAGAASGAAGHRHKSGRRGQVAWACRALTRPYSFRTACRRPEEHPAVRSMNSDRTRRAHLNQQPGRPGEPDGHSWQAAEGKHP